MYADYAFYTEQFYGTAISETDFPRLASRASDFIDYYTKGKAETSDATTALAKCCCALAEHIQTEERNAAIIARAQSQAMANGEIKSETVGSWSASYATAADYKDNNSVKAQASMYADICLHYLVNTGLLYRGGCRV